MLTPAISKVREFLGSWNNLLAIGTLPVLGAWIFSRVWMVNPAILGDEYIYSMNARKVSPWDPPVAGDFSNYLFNLVYSGTNLCGDSFYACAKVLNIVFFLGFVFTLFLVALRFLPFWGAYTFMISAALSPLSVYTSMFLPESMYFFFMGLVLIAVLTAMRAFTWQKWALVGVAIGISSLVKPHAWLSALAVGLTLLIVGMTDRQVGLRTTFISGVSLAVTAAAARVLAGVLVAGPKALGFFGQYFGLSTVQDIVSTGQSSEQVTSPGNPNVKGVFDLFASQLAVHSNSASAIMGFSIMGLLMGLVFSFSQRRRSAETDFILFAAVWFGVLLIEIVVFTGWITGGGDDHSTRVLLRYYDFLFLIVPLAAGAFFFLERARVNFLLRWAGALGTIALISPGFTGFFGTLTVQIADAPVLAGLIVDRFVFDAVAISAVLGILTFASFPTVARYMFIASLPITLVFTGWQTQDQYQIARAEYNSADLAGKELSGRYSETELAKTWILGTSRFDVTNAALWADNPEAAYLPVAPGSTVSLNLAPEGTELVVTIGEIQISGDASLEFEGNGYQIFRVN